MVRKFHREVFEKYLELAGWSTGQLERRAGVAKQMATRWLNGVCVPTEKLTKRVAKAFNKRFLELGLDVRVMPSDIAGSNK